MNNLWGVLTWKARSLATAVPHENRLFCTCNPSIIHQFAFHFIRVPLEREQTLSFVVWRFVSSAAVHLDLAMLIPTLTDVQERYSTPVFKLCADPKLWYIQIYSAPTYARTSSRFRMGSIFVKNNTVMKCNMLYKEISYNALKPGGYCTISFNTQKLCFLPTECICVVSMFLTVNSDFSPWTAVN